MYTWRQFYDRQISCVYGLRTFEYICDLYSEMEILGYFDQTSENRVIGVFGTSARQEEKRTPVCKDGLAPLIN